jgi:hypothetical protein
VRAIPNLKAVEIDQFVGPLCEFPYETTRDKFAGLLDEVNCFFATDPASRAFGSFPSPEHSIGEEM